MIKINLMVKPPPRFVWQRAALLAAAGGALMGLLAGGAIWWAQYETLSSERKDVAALEEEYTKLFAKAPALKEQEDAVRRQQEALAALGRNQAPTGQASVIGQILAAAPPKVIVGQITVSKEGLVALSGEAPSFAAAIQYLTALRALPALESVQERKVTAAADGKSSFIFSGQVRREGKP